MRKMTLIVLFFLTVTTNAALPKGCIIEDVKEDDIQLENQASSVVYVQNKKDVDVFLANNDAQLTSRLMPGVWSVLLVKDIKKIQFSCIESKPGSEQKISCMNVLNICRIKKVTVSESFKQSLWLVQNESLPGSYDMLTIKHVDLA